MKSVHIRKGTESDIPATDEVDLVCFRDLKGRGSIGTQTGPAGIANMMKPSSVFVVAESDSAVVGYALAWPIPHRRGSRALNLDLLAVLPKYQRHGAGTELLNKLVSIAASRCDLVVLTASDKSVGFFKHVGFTVSPRDHALVWKSRPFLSRGSFGQPVESTADVVHVPDMQRGYDFVAHLPLAHSTDLDARSLSRKQMRQNNPDPRGLNINSAPSSKRITFADYQHDVAIPADGRFLEALK